MSMSAELTASVLPGSVGDLTFPGEHPDAVELERWVENATGAAMDAPIV